MSEAPGSARLRFDLGADLDELLVVFDRLDWYRGGELPYVELQPGGTAYVARVTGVAPRLLAERATALARRAFPRARLLEFSTPADLERLHGLTGGAVHHLAVDRTLPGPRTPDGWLYLCGAGTHPGGEISGVPGLNAARAVVDDLG